MANIAPILRCKCAQGLGLAVLCACLGPISRHLSTN